MDFFAIILLLLLYFVRVHDWVPMISGLNIVKPAMALALFGIYTRTRRAPPWKPMRTPHEWVMAAFFLWCLHIDPDPYNTAFEYVLPFTGFYFLTFNALNSEERLDRFFGWWCFCIVFMCLVGVLTDFGIDITNARQMIVEQNGRLCLNTYLLDNPNSMGHTAVTALPLIYMMMVFGREGSLALLAVPLFIMVGVCVIDTQSKGAYLCAAVVATVSVLIGRKIYMQIAAVATLAIVLPAAAAMLPRMMDRSDLRRDEGVMGRLIAFEQGLTAYNTMPAGINKFFANFVWERQAVVKDAHSAYVRIGADLGPTGLFLYLSAMCVSFRSLLRYRTDSVRLERCRRVLITLLVAFVVSGWMINRAYHTEYFLLIAAATAYHRLALERLRGVQVVVGEETAMDRTPTSSEFGVHPEIEDTAVAIAKENESGKIRRFWNRYGVTDFAIGYAALQVTVWFWGYIVDNL
jgi:hypothetical protein